MGKMKLCSIQYLRAIAAIGVVLTHASLALFDRQRALINFELGSSGVDLFFVISGFVMFYTTADDETAPGDFLLRRIIRIVPIYFILSTVAFLMAVLGPQYTRTFSANPYDYLRSIFFVPYINPMYHAMRPEINQGWTLNYEMFFYFVFGVSLFLRANLRIVVCLSIFVILATIGVAFIPVNVFAATYTDSIMLEFMLGVIIGYFLIEHITYFYRVVILFLIASAVVTALIVIIGMDALEIDGVPRLVTAGIPSAAIVSGFIWLERAGKVPALPALLIVGDASYSLYFTHTFVLALMRRIWAKLFDINLPLDSCTFYDCGYGRSNRCSSCFLWED